MIFCLIHFLRLNCGNDMILMYAFLKCFDFSNKGTNADVNIMVKKMTEKTMLLTLSDPFRCDCEIMVARTAAASPLGIIIDKNALSFSSMPFTFDGRETFTTRILNIIIRNEIPNPINNDVRLSNFMEMPTYTKKNVFIRKTSSLNNVFSVGLSRVGLLCVNFFSHLLCMASMLANPMPNARAEMMPLYPNNSLMPNMMKTNAGVVKMELLIVLTLSNTIDQKMEPITPMRDANKNDEKTWPKIIPTLISPYLYDSKIAKDITMHKMALNADSNISIVLLFSPMLICFTNGIATADEEPPNAAPNMKLMPGFIPNTNQLKNPTAVHVNMKFTIVNEIVFLMESANVLNDNSVPLSNKRITSVSCPKMFPMELNLSASTIFNNGPIIIPMNMSSSTSGILLLLKISANQCAANTNVPIVRINKAGSIVIFLQR